MKQRLIVLMALAVFLPVYAVAAQMPQLQGMSQAPAPKGVVEAEPENPVRAPLAAWLVGPSTPDQINKQVTSALQAKCMMVNEFDNGFLIGMHANGRNIIGMSVDTRQQVFQQGQPLQAALILGEESFVVPAQASDERTAMLDLTPIDSARARLQNLVAFGVQIGQQTLYLATTGLSDGFRRMGSCLGAQQAVEIPVAKDVRGTAAPLMQEVTTNGDGEPLALAMASIVPSGYRFDLRDGINPMTPISWVEGDSWRDTLVAALAPLGYRVEIEDRMIIIATNDGQDVRLEAYEAEGVTPTNPQWTALQGARLRDVLNQWGQQAGMKVELDLDGEYMIPSDVAYQGDVADAVDQLIALLAKQDPSLRADITVDPVPMATPEPPRQQSWNALEGSFLEQVLNRWSAGQDVNVIWQAEPIFTLSETIRMTGTYEEALVTVLEQFDGFSNRPLAQLNSDPETGQKILIITASGDKS